ncbi:alanine racemase [Novosphingobium kunmingense]|uniref:Alanine racemase n=1 Tax=Novosphingobium kunmingense TaxID=1211806 RepID=A0A2N0I2T6_9SPHN|nr:alanine racemase [Novosphingobium kunmingense]PKB25460.1 alanine racemase [Novosphingobium kunmingense]
MIPPEPALRLDVDAAALTHNWIKLDTLSGRARAGAAVKADAYGLGVATVVPALWQAGCRDFFVAHWSEATAVAELVPAGAVSVLHGPLTGADAAFARALGVKPVINSLAQAQRWIAAGGGACDLMVDTGINRLGLPMVDLSDPLIKQLSIDLLLSHLASADDESPLNGIQLGRWNEARGLIAHRKASLANSAGIALGPDYHGDVTRPGIALYGGVPCAALAGELRQVARPHAALIQVRDLQAGDSVGYNATFTAPVTMRVGVISLGYADGYLRAWSGGGTMVHQGRTLPVLGRVSMDMTVIDLSAAPDLGEGDWIEVAYDLPHSAALTGLSQYELLTGLGRRFAR